MSEKSVKEINEEEGSVAAIGAKLSHVALEKEDLRLEAKMDIIIESVNGYNGLNKKVDKLNEKVEYTNGKVRAHQVWIAGIVGGAAVFMALVPTTIFFLKDYFVRITAEAVVQQIAEKYEVEVE